MAVNAPAFDVGDYVVYPKHGVGRVVELQSEEIAGMKLELYVLRFEKERMTLRVPVPLSLDLRPEDRAVYIGTLRLHRDEFHGVVRAEVRDEHATAATLVRERFDPGMPLRRALLKLPRP